MTFGSLFAGIGGFDLGLERAGMTCKWQVEIEPFARRVIERHWPHVRRHDDVRTFPPTQASDWSVDLVCGGFPCQDISLAGKGAGIEGERSGLWFEFARVLRLLRPRYVIVENSPALANRGLSSILGTLAELGLNAEWGVLPASAFGASHIRARMFVVAYPQRTGRDGLHERQQAGRLASDPGLGRQDGTDRLAAPDPTVHVAHADGSGLSVGEEQILLVQQPAPVGSGWWAVEPDVVRVVDGLPRGAHRTRRIRALGNAVVPQIAQYIGERLMKLEG